MQKLMEMYYPGDDALLQILIVIGAFCGLISALRRSPTIQRYALAAVISFVAVCVIKMAGGAPAALMRGQWLWLHLVTLPFAILVAHFQYTGGGFSKIELIGISATALGGTAVFSYYYTETVATTFFTVSALIFGAYWLIESIETIQETKKVPNSIFFAVAIILLMVASTAIRSYRFGPEPLIEAATKATNAVSETAATVSNSSREFAQGINPQAAAARIKFRVDTNCFTRTRRGVEYRDENGMISIYENIPAGASWRECQ